MSITIETNIPLPTKREKWASVAAQMVEGNSVLVDSVSKARGLTVALTRVGKSSSTLQEPMGDIKKYRVFCIGATRA